MTIRNQLKFNILPPPIRVNKDITHGASRSCFEHGVSRPHNCVDNGSLSRCQLINMVNPLSQLVKTSCGRIFCVLTLMLALSACEHPDIPESSETMKLFFRESCHLSEVEQDSISRFVAKVCEYIKQNPTEANDPFLPDIQQNILDAAELNGIQVDTVWGDTINVWF